MNRIGRAALPVACLAVATLLAWALERWARLDDASPIYLLAVTAVAVACGTVPAIATAVAAFFVYNFVFVEPRLSLAVAGGQELLTLIVLLVVGIVIGRLAGIGRDRAAVALRREREARALFVISRSLATSARAEATLPVVTERVAVEGALDRAWIGLGSTIAQERVVADTMPGDELPPTDRHAVLQRDQHETSVSWMRVRGPAAAAEPRSRRTATVYRVAIAYGPEAIGSLWGVAPGDPPLETARLMAVTADQVAQAIRRDQLARLAVERAVAERSDEAKSALLELVSHDLRTPLAAIRASAGSLADVSLSLRGDERRQLAVAIDREAMRLSRLVENLLGMSRLQGGATAIEIELIPVTDAVRGIVERLGSLLVEHPVELHLPEDLPPACADATFLDQVLINLLENAASHTPPGSPVRIAVRTTDDGDIQILVEDGGGGVPDAELPRIFDRFHRVAAAKRRSQRGAGLGLALVRGLTEAMGGTVRAARSPLGGLAIIVRLPAGPVPPP
ncbi:MAG: ATP-binding protein [Chloroflexota bacterium]